MTNDPRGKRARSAAEWFTVMRGADADTERGAFEEWHALPENAAAYARLEETWNESRFLANSAAGRSRNLAGARRKFPPGALLAAGIGLFALLSGSLYAERVGWFGPAAVNRSAPAQFVAHDAVRTIRLPDGSRVTLGRGAALRDVSTSDERRFVLLRGRARFEVAHDSARSFLVDAGEGRVVAHGTVFDVGFEQGNARYRHRCRARGAGPPPVPMSPGRTAPTRNSQYHRGGPVYPRDPACRPSDGRANAPEPSGRRSIARR